MDSYGSDGYEAPENNRTHKDKSVMLEGVNIMDKRWYKTHHAVIARGLLGNQCSDFKIGVICTLCLICQ